MSEKIATVVENSARRVQDARAVADSLRHDDRLHRLAMKAVFILEDCHEALVLIRRERVEERR